MSPIAGLDLRIGTPLFPPPAHQDLPDRKITDALWERKSEEWREAQVRVRAAIQRHEQANQCCFEGGFRILELARRAYDLWLEQEEGSPVVSGNALWVWDRDGNLYCFAGR